MTTNVNFDDALGTGDGYTDQQGVFSEQKPTARALGESARKGGAAAKIFMIAFGAILAASLGWFVWKLMNRGGAIETMGESLPAAVTSPMSVPMTGAPVEEPLGPVSLEEGPAAAIPVDPSLVAATSPGVPPGPAAASSSSIDPGTAPVAPPHKTSAPLAAAATPPIRTQGAAPDADERLAPIPTSSAGDAAAPRDSQLLKDALARIAVLERRVASLEPAIPSKVRPSETSLRSRSVAPPRVTASPERKGDPAAKAPMAGVTLKAVLEGRAWLQLGSGETVTAAPGDEVAGLGAVSSIDAERGEVRFANGSVLR